MDVFRCSTALWRIFSQYHYLDATLNTSSVCYGIFMNKQCVAFCAILPFPHSVRKYLYRVHRLVVLPEYQGLGLGKRFLNILGNKYANESKTLSIVTSNIALNMTLQRDDNWICTRRGKVAPLGSSSTIEFSRTLSLSRVTSAWEFTRQGLMKYMAYKQRIRKIC